MALNREVKEAMIAIRGFSGRPKEWLLHSICNLILPDLDFPLRALTDTRESKSKPILESIELSFQP